MEVPNPQQIEEINNVPLNTLFTIPDTMLHWMGCIEWEPECKTDHIPTEFSQAAYDLVYPPTLVASINAHNNSGLIACWP